MKGLGVFLLLFPFWIHAQEQLDGTAENTAAESQNMQKAEINGFFRSAYFTGLGIEKDALQTKAAYGELGLKLKAIKGSLGGGFAEIRMRRGLELGEAISETRLREAYVSLYPGSWDIKVGEQIVVWGRADGYNPTNNLTPQNMLIRSADDDERRLGNFMIRSFWNHAPLRLELAWIPRYSPSVLPIHLFSLPDNVTTGETWLPDESLKNSSFAAKLHGEFSSFDGSVSYMQGYMPLPGIDATATVHAGGGISVFVMPHPYRMHVYGADLALNLGRLGLRSEIAYRDPIDDYRTELYVPNPDLQWVIGGDRSWGDFSLIMQIVGRYVQDFQPLVSTGSDTDEIFLKNRMISMQQDELSHGLTFRPALTLFHETLTLETLGFVLFSTEEIYLRPKITWWMADEFTLTAGGDFYLGPDNTLFGSIDRALNSVFTEFRISF